MQNISCDGGLLFFLASSLFLFTDARFPYIPLATCPLLAGHPTPQMSPICSIRLPLRRTAVSASLSLPIPTTGPPLTTCAFLFHIYPSFLSNLSRYNHYLSDDNAGDRRSGVNALGLGLMNMVNDDDDDNNNNNVPAAPPPPPSKHAALAAAVAMPPKRLSPPPQHIVAPRPGYAAPIATLNLARPEPVVSKDTSPINFKINSPPNPFADPHSPHPVSSSPPMMSNEPHPLQSPVTPITPVFARPKPNVTFSETAVPRPPKPIVRGNSEDTLLPGRGEKGDDFWRRFSMVVKEENRKSPSQKTRYFLPHSHHYFLTIPFRVTACGSGKPKTVLIVSHAGFG